MPDRPPYKAERLIFRAADSRRMWELGRSGNRNGKEALAGRHMEPPRSFRLKRALLNRLRLETLQRPLSLKGKTVANTVAPGAKKRAKDCLDELEEDGDAVMAAEPRLPLRTETVPPRPSMHSSSKQRPTPSHFTGRR